MCRKFSRKIHLSTRYTHLSWWLFATLNDISAATANPCMLFPLKVTIYTRVSQITTCVFCPWGTGMKQKRQIFDELIFKIIQRFKETADPIITTTTVVCSALFTPHLNLQQQDIFCSTFFHLALQRHKCYEQPNMLRKAHCLFYKSTVSDFANVVLEKKKNFWSKGESKNISLFFKKYQSLFEKKMRYENLRL